MNEKKHQEQQTLKNKIQFKRIILYARQHRANQGVNESLYRLVDFWKNKRYKSIRTSIRLRDLM